MKRKGAHEIAENTIQAFAHANSRGSKILEMDLCLTKDEVILIDYPSNIVSLVNIGL